MQPQESPSASKNLVASQNPESRTTPLSTATAPAPFRRKGAALVLGGLGLILGSCSNEPDFNEETLSQMLQTPKIQKIITERVEQDVLRRVNEKQRIENESLEKALKQLVRQEINLQVLKAMPEYVEGRVESETSEALQKLSPEVADKVRINIETLIRRTLPEYYDALLTGRVTKEVKSQLDEQLKALYAEREADIIKLATQALLERSRLDQGFKYAGGGR